MSKLRVHFSISIDGFGAGPNQDLPESARSWRTKLRTLTQPLPKGEEIAWKAVVSRPWAGVSSGQHD